MTRNEFIASWSGADADTRFANFRSWIFEHLSGLEDLLPLITITRDPAETSLKQLGPGHIVVPSSFFEDTTPDRALDAGEAIINVYLHVAMKSLYEEQKERENYEKEYKKWRDKMNEKLLKDSKPKGSKAGYGDYLYFKKMKELEYGSG